MGSVSDWEVMSAAAETLETFGVAYEKRIVSAHRTPDLLAEYAKTAKSRGIEVIIAGAGGAAHLPACRFDDDAPGSGSAGEIEGVERARFPALHCADACRRAGGDRCHQRAKNAALVAVSILALHDEALALALEDFRRRQTETVLMTELQ